MQRCLQLAQNGLGYTYPNPLVGSVITVNNKIIGEGWHLQSGKPHAEINAINSVKDKSLLKDATIFVNLEPCSHYGKTPPCSHKIVELGIPKVVIGTRDYASHVNGQGIKYLKEHNVEVIENVLEKEAFDINKRFFTFQQKKRPYIILKWAETANGFFAPKDNTQKWITNSFSKQLVHQWRTQEQAILVGGQTVRADNPELNARLWKGNNPIKVILSNQLNEIKDYKIFSGEQTIIINQDKTEEKDNIKWVKINSEENLIKQILDVLYQNGIQSVIIEGGKKILTQFIKSNIWDEARVLKGNTNWNNGIKTPELNHNQKVKETSIGDDSYILYQNHTL